MGLVDRLQDDHEMKSGYALMETAFPRDYYLGNIALVQGDLRAKGLAAVLIFDPESIYWLTGYRSIGYFTFQCALVQYEGGPTLISRRVNRAIALSNENIADFVGIEDTDDAVEILCCVLKARTPAPQPIGVETNSGYLTVQAWKGLAQALANDLVDWGGLIERARQIKSETQLGYMRKAAQAAVAGLNAAVKAIAPGRTENDLAAAMLHAATAAGSEYTRVPLVVAGKATGVCFTTWQRRPILHGDVVLLEAAANINRYHAMIARTCIAGKASAEHKLWAGLVLESLDRAIEAIRPGVTVGMVDAACRAVFDKAGVGQYFDHRTGYSMGIGFPPNWAEGRFLALRPGDMTVLEVGMTFHVVPSLFMPDFGFCFSESVAVTEEGAEILTDYPRRLLEANV